VIGDALLLRDPAKDSFGLLAARAQGFRVDLLSTTSSSDAPQLLSLSLIELLEEAHELRGLGVAPGGLALHILPDESSALLTVVTRARAVHMVQVPLPGRSLDTVDEGVAATLPTEVGLPVDQGSACVLAAAAPLPGVVLAALSNGSISIAAASFGQDGALALSDAQSAVLPSPSLPPLDLGEHIVPDAAIAMTAIPLDTEALVFALRRSGSLEVWHVPERIRMLEGEALPSLVSSSPIGPRPGSVGYLESASIQLVPQSRPLSYLLVVSGAGASTPREVPLPFQPAAMELTLSRDSLKPSLTWLSRSGAAPFWEDSSSSRAQLGLLRHECAVVAPQSVAPVALPAAVVDSASPVVMQSLQPQLHHMLHSDTAPSEEGAAHTVEELEPRSFSVWPNPPKVDRTELQAAGGGVMFVSLGWGQLAVDAAGWAIAQTTRDALITGAHSTKSLQAPTDSADAAAAKVLSGAEWAAASLPALASLVGTSPLPSLEHASAAIDAALRSRSPASASPLAHRIHAWETALASFPGAAELPPSPRRLALAPLTHHCQRAASALAESSMALVEACSGGWPAVLLWAYLQARSASLALCIARVHIPRSVLAAGTTTGWVSHCPTVLLRASGLSALSTTEAPLGGSIPHLSSSLPGQAWHALPPSVQCALRAAASQGSPALLATCEALARTIDPRTAAAITAHDRHPSEEASTPPHRLSGSISRVLVRLPHRPSGSISLPPLPVGPQATARAVAALSATLIRSNADAAACECLASAVLTWRGVRASDPGAALASARLSTRCCSLARFAPPAWGLLSALHRNPLHNDSAPTLAELDAEAQAAVTGKRATLCTPPSFAIEVPGAPASTLSFGDSLVLIKGGTALTAEQKGLPPLLTVTDTGLHSPSIAQSAPTPLQPAGPLTDALLHTPLGSLAVDAPHSLGSWAGAFAALATLDPAEELLIGIEGGDPVPSPTSASVHVHLEARAAGPHSSAPLLPIVTTFGLVCPVERALYSASHFHACAALARSRESWSVTHSAPSGRDAVSEAAGAAAAAEEAVRQKALLLALAEARASFNSHNPAGVDSALAAVLAASPRPDAVWPETPSRKAIAERCRRRELPEEQLVAAAAADVGLAWAGLCRLSHLVATAELSRSLSALKTAASSLRSALRVLSHLDLEAMCVLSGSLTIPQVASSTPHDIGRWAVARVSATSVLVSRLVSALSQDHQYDAALEAVAHLPLPGDRHAAVCALASAACREGHLSAILPLPLSSADASAIDSAIVRAAAVDNQHWMERSGAAPAARLEAALSSMTLPRWMALEWSRTALSSAQRKDNEAASKAWSIASSLIGRAEQLSQGDHHRLLAQCLLPLAASTPASGQLPTSRATIARALAGLKPCQHLIRAAAAAISVSVLTNGSSPDKWVVIQDAPTHPSASRKRLSSESDVKGPLHERSSRAVSVEWLSTIAARLRSLDAAITVTGPWTADSSEDDDDEDVLDGEMWARDPLAIVAAALLASLDPLAESDSREAVLLWSLPRMTVTGSDMSASSRREGLVRSIALTTGSLIGTSPRHPWPFARQVLRLSARSPSPAPSSSSTAALQQRQSQAARLSSIAALAILKGAGQAAPAIGFPHWLLLEASGATQSREQPLLGAPHITECVRMLCGLGRPHEALTVSAAAMPPAVGSSATEADALVSPPYAAVHLAVAAAARALGAPDDSDASIESVLGEHGPAIDLGTALERIGSPAAKRAIPDDLLLSSQWLAGVGGSLEWVGDGASLEARARLAAAARALRSRLRKYMSTQVWMVASSLKQTRELRWARLGKLDPVTHASAAGRVGVLP
jgi:hypothetical protein